MKKRRPKRPRHNVLVHVVYPRRRLSLWKVVLERCCWLVTGGVYTHFFL